VPPYRGRLADEPGSPPDDDHLWQRPTALLALCVEGTQARDECACIAAAVRVVLPNERPAASFVRLVLFHLLTCATAADMRTVLSAAVVTVDDVIDGHVDRDIPQSHLVAEGRRYMALDFASYLVSRVAVADRNG